MDAASGEGRIAEDGAEASAPVDPTAERRRVEAAAETVRLEMSRPPVLGLILEAGGERLADAMEVEARLSYDQVSHDQLPHDQVSHDQLPHAPRAAAGEGTLRLGTLNGASTVVLHGHAASAEGRTARQGVFPVRVLAALGVQTFLIVGAAAGLRSDLRAADAMLVSDHLNLRGDNPLVGPNVEAWGPRFPDMTAPYDAALRRQAQAHATESGFTLRQGILAATPGPVLTTPAEGRMLRRLGADAVGAGVVPAVIAARHMDRRVWAVALITGRVGDGASPTDTDAHAAPADEAASKLLPLVRELAGAVG